MTQIEKAANCFLDLSNSQEYVDAFMIFEIVAHKFAINGRDLLDELTSRGVINLN